MGSFFTHSIWYIIYAAMITKEENGMTDQFKCVFSANNQRITQIVTANSAMEAKKIIELQYRGLRLIWWECRKL